MKFLLLLALGVLCVAGEETKYDDYRVYRINPKTQEQINLLLSLERGNNDLDFWSSPNPAGRPVDVMVSPHDQRPFLSLMNSNGMPADIMIEDVQKKIATQRVARTLGSKMTWTQYYKIDEIYEWLDSLPALYPGIVEVVIGGSTYENRDIKGVKISFGPGRRGVFIEGGIHAREWITPATANYFINELLTSTDETFRSIAENFDWHIFPSTNPDGYAFTQSNRMWRKTRTPYPGCNGADGNRNYDFFWGQVGSSNQPCSETYAGPRPDSEIETSSIIQYLDTIGSTLDVYLSFHSYGQYILIPYGHTTQHLENYDDLYKIATAAAASIARRYNTWYTYGNTAEILYAVSGSSTDYAKDKYKIPIAYTFEFRDTGRNGFLLPANEIIPNCLEIMDGIITIFQEAAKLPSFNSRQ